jgi:hypothetical protein
MATQVALSEAPTQPLVALGALTPQVHFPYSAPDHWKRDGITLPQLAAALELLRVRVKQAANYSWDNSHFFIDDIYGHPALKIQTHGDGSIGIWEANHNTAVGLFGSIPDDLGAMVGHAQQGEVLCHDCGQWVSEFRRFSFAGAACLTCYDPTKHLPPDTRGD